MYVWCALILKSYVFMFTINAMKGTENAQSVQVNTGSQKKAAPTDYKCKRTRAIPHDKIYHRYLDSLVLRKREEPNQAVG